MLLAVTFLILAACAAAEFFKRYFLSLPVVYHIAMLFSILAMTYSTLSLMSSMSHDFYWFASHVVRLMALAVYLRGNIFPINKKLDKYCSDPELYAAKRLISTGVLGVCLFTALAYIVFIYNQNQEFEYSPSGESIAAQLAYMILILCVLMSALAGVLITNGCIRYINNTDKDGFKKYFRIFLTFVPVLNFFYGIVCFIKIKLEVA